MAAAALKILDDFASEPLRGVPRLRLAELATLGETDIENGLVANLSANLHSLFDPVADDTLPIYFGPLLGRLYLEGL